MNQVVILFLIFIILIFILYFNKSKKRTNKNVKKAVKRAMKAIKKGKIVNDIYNDTDNDSDNYANGGSDSDSDNENPVTPTTPPDFITSFTTIQNNNSEFILNVLPSDGILGKNCTNSNYDNANNYCPTKGNMYLIQVVNGNPKYITWISTHALFNKLASLGVHQSSNTTLGNGLKYLGPFYPTN